MRRTMGWMLAAVLMMGVATGCRQWRAERNEYRTRQAKAGALLGKSPEEVRTALGAPTLSHGEGNDLVYEYTLTAGTPRQVDGYGFDKPSNAYETDAGETYSRTMRVYFQDGKMVGVRGN